jgi:hypothetical protein
VPEESIDITPTERFMLLCSAWPKDKGRAYQASGLHQQFAELLFMHSADGLGFQNWDAKSPSFQLRRIINMRDQQCGYVFSEGNNTVTSSLSFLSEGPAFKLYCVLAHPYVSEADMTMTLLGAMSEALRQPVCERLRYYRPGESVFPSSERSSEQTSYHFVPKSQLISS